MININLSALIQSLTPACVSALEDAAGACMSRGGHEIGIEDYIAKLLPLEAMQDILAQYDLHSERVLELLEKGRKRNERSSSAPVFSALLVEFLQEAYLLASLELHQEKIDVGVLVLTLLLNPARYGLMPFYEEIGKIPANNLRSLLEGLQNKDNSRSSGNTGATAMNSGGEGFINKYATDFTAEAKAGRIDPVFARGHEIRQMIDILTRRRKNNPILVGDPGVGKTAVVEGLALKIVENLVPDALKGVRIVGLDMGRLSAGASVKGEFEKRLKGIIDEVKGAATPTIMFIDEAHTLVGSGNAAGGGDGANLLKPALARGELRTIAATTWSEYKKYFEKDAALARRFQLVKLDEPSIAETITILRGIVPHYENTHKVYVRDDSVVRTAELASRYISGRQLPDKAIDVLDTACARVRVSLGAKPSVLERLEEELAAVRRELDAIERDQCQGLNCSNHSNHALLTARFATLTQEVDSLTKRWNKERELVAEIIALRSADSENSGAEPQLEPSESEANSPANSLANDLADDLADSLANTAETSLTNRSSLENLLNSLAQVQSETPLVFHEVSPELITSIVSEWTGVPTHKLSGTTDPAKISEFGAALRKRILGQEHAISAIEKNILASQAGLDNPNAPTGIFLLVGPSGVGKTETALAIADELFGGERFLVSINMSEFQEKHTISRLIGSPPGYVGYGEGGRLTEAVRKQPYSAILFDEVEKAHPDVLNLFYQMFDKGVLADGEGRDIDFRNTLIFMTSNLGGEIVSALCESGQNPDLNILHEALRPALSQFFKPALLGRMTIVPYLAICPDILNDLVNLKLDHISKRLQKQHNIPLSWAEEVSKNIAASCTAVDTGARNIDHIISSTLLPGIATHILSRLSCRESQAASADTLHICLDPENGVFKYQTK